MTHVTCRLTAKDRDQLRNPTLGNRVWATFTFFRYRYKTGREEERRGGREFVLCRRNKKDNSASLYAERCGWNATKDGRRCSSSVVVLSYPQYCRYRAARRRLETAPSGGGRDAPRRDRLISDAVLRAVGMHGPAPASRVMFCRSTFVHPDVDHHEFRRDLLCKPARPTLCRLSQ